MDDPSLMSAVELTRALRRRDVSSRELLEVFLRRIEADEGGVNAVVTVDEQSATSRADAMDEALGARCAVRTSVRAADDREGHLRDSRSADNGRRP